MEALLSLFALLIVVLFFTALVLGSVAFFRVRSLQQQLQSMEKKFDKALRQLMLNQQQKHTQTSDTELSATEPLTTPATAPLTASKPPTTASETAPEAEAAAETQPEAQAVPFAAAASAPAASITEASSVTETSSAPSVATPSAAKEPGFIDRLSDNMRNHWMVWLGGICVGLAGIFMVRYSIEQGLLGPQARIILSLLTGTGLHMGAEWLRRNKGQNPVFAALAGGASIILYAALFAAFKLLPGVSPTLIFAALALVSFATLALALRHGPVLATLGMLGGYIVPLLVNTGSGNIAMALIYITILTAFSLWLVAYVQKRWLWAGVIAGSLLWWLLSLAASPADGVRSLYLLALAYLFLAVPRFDWLLTQKSEKEDQRSWLQYMQHYIRENADWPALAGLVLIVIAQAITLTIEGVADSHYFIVLLLPALLLGANRRAELNPLTALLLPLIVLATFVSYLSEQQNQLLFIAPDIADQSALAIRFMLLAVLYCSVSLWLLRRHVRYPAFWSGLASATPLLLMAAGYYLFSAFHSDWAWGLIAALLGLLYLWLTRISKNLSDLVTVVLITAAHVGFSLAAVIMLEEATLTLAVAAQLVSMAALQRHYQLAFMPWVIRAVLAIVVCRITFNPWLLSYPPGSHWSLWTFGGSTLCSAAAAWILRAPEFRKMQAWLQGGAIHLLVLTLAAEIRYWLYDGDIFRQQFSFTEASLDVFIWGTASLIYFWRAGQSQYMQKFYHIVSLIHLGLAGATYALIILLRDNPLWTHNSAISSEIGILPLWNLLLLSYGIPTLIMAAWWYLRRDQYRYYAAAAAGLNALLFISLEIRHLWQQGAMSLNQHTSDGELYTYSVVWMLIAAAVMTAAQKLQQQTLYRAGMALLLVVVAKLFLVDMSGLTGLWRVASFMGLGLALLGLAWLHQRFAPAQGETGQDKDGKGETGKNEAAVK